MPHVPGPRLETPTLAVSPERVDVQMRIVEAQEAERPRLAQEIHDGPAQALSNAIFQVEYIERVIETDPPLARTELRYLRELLRRELGDVRSFISQLRPPRPRRARPGRRDPGHGRAHPDADRGDITTDLTAPDDALTDAERTVVLRVAQEALQNVRKHAQAADRVRRRPGSDDARLGPRGPRRRSRLRRRGGGRARPAQLRSSVHARASGADRRPLRRTISTGRRHRRPPGDPDPSPDGKKESR